MVSQDNIVRRLYIIELACTWFSYQKEKKKNTCLTYPLSLKHRHLHRKWHER
jgi:hypothetical protein